MATSCPAAIPLQNLSPPAAGQRAQTSAGASTQSSASPNTAEQSGNQPLPAASPPAPPAAPPTPGRNAILEFLVATWLGNLTALMGLLGMLGSLGIASYSLLLQKESTKYDRFQACSAEKEMHKTSTYCEEVIAAGVTKPSWPLSTVIKRNMQFGTWESRSGLLLVYVIAFFVFLLFAYPALHVPLDTMGEKLGMVFRDEMESRRFQPLEALHTTAQAATSAGSNLRRRITKSTGESADAPTKSPNVSEASQSAAGGWGLNSADTWASFKQRANEKWNQWKRMSFELFARSIQSAQASGIAMNDAVPDDVRRIIQAAIDQLIRRYI